MSNSTEYSGQVFLGSEQQELVLNCSVGAMHQCDFTAGIINTTTKLGTGDDMISLHLKKVDSLRSSAPVSILQLGSNFWTFLFVDFHV